MGWVSFGAVEISSEDRKLQCTLEQTTHALVPVVLQMTVQLVGVIRVFFSSAEDGTVGGGAIVPFSRRKRRGFCCDQGFK